MNSVEKFNGLNGAIVSREEIVALILKASEQEQPAIVTRLNSVLENYPEKTAFEFDIETPAIEVVPNSFLYCLDCEQEAVEENTGLAKAVSPNDVYQMITDRMLSLIKEANSKDYKKTWSAKTYGKGYTIPFNFASKKRYRGVNLFLLTDFKPLENPFFLNFKQVEEMKGTITKGAKGLPVVYFTKLFKVEDKAKNIDFGTYDFKKAVEFAKSKGISIDRISKIPILKYYNVFNGKDITGIDFDLKNFKTGYIENELPAIASNRMPIADAIVNNYPKPAPPIKHGGDRAFYKPAADSIQMPYLVDFDTAQDYYRTLFHELSHSTGDSARLNRDFSGRFGDKKYAFEELVAEWGAVFLSAEAGIIFHTNKNHAGYIKGWNNALTQMKDDNRFIMRACTEAQKVADFVLQFNDENEPLYIKDLKKDIDKPKPQPVKKKIPNKEAKPTKLPAAKKPKPIKKIIEAPAKRVEKAKIKTAPPKKLIKPVKKEILKVDKNGQFSLLGVAAQEEEKVVPQNKQSLAYRIANQPTEVDYFDISDKDISSFLGNIERKNKESIVVSLTGGQGSMKTRFAFQFMNALAQKYKVGHASIEEHPESVLYFDKVNQYLNETALHNIEAPEVKCVQDLENLIKCNDVIVIDSFAKLQEIDRNFEVDKDLRKKYDGKLFLVIFQQTTDGKMRGGSKSQFDADIVLFTQKESDYRNNYVYADKNRYQSQSLEKLHYNIFNGELVNYEPESVATETQPEEQPQYSFEVN